MFLSQKYNCHINVKVCTTKKEIKYICKYVYTGSDMATITINGQDIEANEIQQYPLGRYISPVEACNRLFMHLTQGSTHSVVNLQGGLSWPCIDGATSQYRGSRTMLTEFSKLCTLDPEGTAHLLYKNVTAKFRWHNSQWKPYKQYATLLGRIVHVLPQGPDRFYLRLLLSNRRSPKSFEDLRRVGSVAKRIGRNC
ncbi:Helitron helicase-like protein [Phytophthora palmivora]|uniref:Helitron helicase-like protein n=1 Tax=Phytophthora palmivora TaxID=4796 RepID=A0A2P4YFN5_9STRA|nr:Helitron helicase-like protein [Phytophthora palmivora]